MTFENIIELLPLNKEVEIQFVEWMNVQPLNLIEELETIHSKPINLCGDSLYLEFYKSIFNNHPMLRKHQTPLQLYVACLLYKKFTTDKEKTNSTAMKQ